jgi:hypothetical protein
MDLGDLEVLVYLETAAVGVLQAPEIPILFHPVVVVDLHMGGTEERVGPDITVVPAGLTVERTVITMVEQVGITVVVVDQATGAAELAV